MRTVNFSPPVDLNLPIVEAVVFSNGLIVTSSGKVFQNPKLLMDHMNSLHYTLDATPEEVIDAELNGKSTALFVKPGA